MKKTILIGILLLFMIQISKANILYVDNSLSFNCLSTYNPSTRTCGGGTAKAYNTITGAANIAAAGDTVLIRTGTYNEQLSPQNSGTALAFIVFKNYKNEQPIISGATLNPAVWIYEKNYIVIEGLIIKNVVHWLNALGSNNNIIKNNTFKNANDPNGSSKTGLFFQNSDYNQILNNTIDSSTQDNIALVQSDHNLVQGNTITRAKHVLWTIKCGNYNVLRSNYFHNAMQKIGEIYDCDAVGYGNTTYPKITSLDDTKHNVVEDNVFAFTFTPLNASPYAGIQHAGQYSIIRRNIFYNCTGPPVDLTLYPDEATFNYGNRIYHNVFYDNEFGGITIAGGNSYKFEDNIFKNNILYHNRFTQYDTRWSWYTTIKNKPVQIMTGRTYNVLFERNNIFSTQADELWTIAYGDRTSTSNPAPQSLSWWQTNYPAMFKNNLQVDPMFVDTSSKDFHLKTGSSMVDAGVFLTKTSADGNGTTMAVDTADYFRDGFGIKGLKGDTIQLQGQTQFATITSINYTSKTLTLSNALNWTAGQRVSLKYNGKAPDLGAFEAMSGSTGTIHKIPVSEIYIYPNPARNFINISLDVYESSLIQLQLLNVLGQIFYSETHDKISGSYTKTIFLNDKPKGVYFLKVSLDEKTLNKKIIIE